MAQTERDSEDLLLDAETERAIGAALRNAADPEDEEVALSVVYDPRTDLLIMQLKSGRRVAIPCEDLQGLSAASADELVEIEIVGPGTALHWPRLQEGFPVAALAQGTYGSERWMNGLATRRKEIGNLRLVSNLRKAS